MSNWDSILDEAEWLAQQFHRRGVDLAEAEKIGDYYTDKACNDQRMVHYLELMASRPPPRSQRSQHHFENLRDIWHTWRTSLTGKDKARAWGWGVRGAKTLKGGR